MKSNWSNFSDFTYEDLRKSGIDADYAGDLYEIQDCNEVTESAYDFCTKGKAGYLIPFFDPVTGKQMRSLKNNLPFARKRLATPIGTMKYDSIKDGGQRAYILKNVHDYLMSNLSNTVVLTEGEKKAICATERGYYTIGLCGNYGWTYKKRLLPELCMYLRNKDWQIIFDEDASSNKQFDKSAKALAKELALYGVSLRMTILPAIEGYKKVGLDDYLLYKERNNA